MREARHTEGLDGTDTLDITCTEDLQKNEYIVWRDQQGLWHEHIVDSHKRTHDDAGAPFTVASCINSIAETWDDYVTDKRPSGSAYMALSSILETSRWTAGNCTQEGTATHTFYHESVREAIGELLETWGGELETVIYCDGVTVQERSVRVMALRGNQSSNRRFTWTKDLKGISREVANTNPKSRIYAYGKGEETESGGYGRRIGIESVNDGLPYVEDATATALWGHPMRDGTTAPACGIYISEQCEDPAQLLTEAMDYLDKAKEPVVTYTSDVIDLASFGRDWEDVAIGDLVAIIDREFSDEGLRLKGRVSKVERDLLTYETKITFGNLYDAIANPWHSMQSTVQSLSARASNWDQASDASTGWLETLIAGLNAAYDRAGTYRHSSFEHGDIWSSVPLDADGKPTQSGGWAMNANGMGFRLASSTLADGSWNWRTFGTGNGFVADEIVAGVLHSAGYETWINLNTGEAMLSSGSSLGGRDVSSVLSDLSAAGVDITNLQSGLEGETTAREEALADVSDSLGNIRTDLSDAERRLAAGIEDAKRFATDYLSYANGELTLGNLLSVVKLVLTHQLLKFTTNEGDIAWFGRTPEDVWNLFIETATIGNMLRFGDFAWIARSNGNMTLKWVGE